MGAFDQAARYAARADPAAVLARVLAQSGADLRFREWLDTRALPLPGGPDRTANLVACLDDPAAPEWPWLLVLEFQGRHDPDKLDVTLEEAAVLRWREVVASAVADRRARGNLAGVALVLAELAGCRGEWERGLEGFEMTESQVVNEWVSRGEAKGRLEERRQNLLRLLEKRFPGAVPAEVAGLIAAQDSLEVLAEWFDAAAGAYTLQQFLDVLRR